MDTPPSPPLVGKSARMSSANTLSLVLLVPGDSNTGQASEEEVSRQFGLPAEK